MEGNSSFNVALAIVRSLRVVNDTTEHGVTLSQKYKDKITKDQTKKRAFYTVVSHDRQEKKKRRQIRN